MHLFRVIETGSHGLEWAASLGVPRIALFGDTAFCLLIFAASCAISGLRTGREGGYVQCEGCYV